MPSSVGTSTPARPTPPVPSAKPILWILMAVGSLSVLLFYELPLFNPLGPYAELRGHLISERSALIPHALFGTTAFFIGPFQFSTRLRRRSLPLHRILGRVYVFSVFIAAAFALYMSFEKSNMLWVWVHGLVWAGCTLAAVLLARNRQMIPHRQWMIRSYAVTFSFILLRIPKPWPAYANMSPMNVGFTVIIVTFLCVCLPDLAFNWRELTHRRA